MRLVGLELGGTNAIVVLGNGTEIEQRVKLPVSDGAATLALIGEQIAEWQSDQAIDALGIASFGPVGIHPGNSQYGQVLNSPKPGWAGTDLIGALQPLIDGPVAIHTDVTAAALAEARWGAARGCTDFAYMTVGTGIGIGIIAGGRPIVGQLHPEGGHIRVRRRAGDGFQGTCLFHGDCLEGLASGPALAARTGLPGVAVGDDDEVWDDVIDALAETCAMLFLTLSSQRIMIGGGVINARPWLIDRIAERSAGKLESYLPFIAGRAPVFAAGLGADAGPRGSLILAEGALAEIGCLPLE